MEPSVSVVGQVGYLTAMLAFLVLAVYFRPDNFSFKSVEARVRIACLITALWAAAAALHARFDWFTTTGLLFFDAIQLAGWLGVLASMAALQNQPSWLRQSLFWIPAVVLSGALLGTVFSMSPGRDAVIGGWVSLLLLLQPLLGVVAIEQVFRNASSSVLPALRWLFVGVGMMLASDLYLLADSIAFQGLDTMLWHARSLAFVLAAPAIYKGLRAAGQEWQIGLFVSRQVVFYTLSFVLVGAYLIAMSIGAAYLGTRAGNLGVIAQTGFVVALGAILLVLMFSGALRRRLMAFVSTHFYRNRYDYRIEWQRFVQTLSSRSAQDNLNECAIGAVCQIVESAAGRLWLVDETGKALRHGADWPAVLSLRPSQGLGLEAPLVVFMQRTGWVVDLAEREVRPELYENAEIPADLFALGNDAIVVPLLHVDSLYGLLLLRRPPGKKTLHFEDRDLLKMVGRHLAAHLWQVDSDRRLADSRQFEAYNRMTAFVMHDLKNLTAQLQLVVSNAEKHKRNPDFVDDAIATIANSVERMGKLLGQLTQESRTGVAKSVSLADIARRVALRASARLPAPSVNVLEDVSAVADPEQLAMVLDHVVRNAQDATAAGGEVSIEVARDSAAPVLRVKDTGMGMDDSFVRDRLFRPFDTTKGARGMGIGAYQVKEYLRSLGGDVQVVSHPGIGTTFTLVFPHG